MLRNTVLFFALSLSIFHAFEIKAQAPVIEIQKDTLIDSEGGVSLKNVDMAKVETIKMVSTHDPRRATMLAVAVPGLGQIYNGKYWKLPIVYGGLATLGYFIHYNNDLYITVRRELIKELEGKPRTDPRLSRLNEASLRRNVDRFRRDRDYLIILTGVAYALTVVDAHVDAHLKEFDVNDDLSFKISPSLAPTGMATMQAGISLKLYFR